MVIKNIFFNGNNNMDLDLNEFQLIFFLLGKEVLKRWKNLRDSFAKSEKKMKEGKASGAQATRKRKYIFNEELQF